MKYWPTCRSAECLKIHFRFGEKASDFRARPILGELLYIKSVVLTVRTLCTDCSIKVFRTFSESTIAEKQKSENWSNWTACYGLVATTVHYKISS